MRFPRASHRLAEDRAERHQQPNSPSFTTLDPDLQRRACEEVQAYSKWLVTELRESLVVSGCVNVEAELREFLATENFETLNLGAGVEQTIGEIAESLQRDAIRQREAMPPRRASNRRIDDRAEYFRQLNSLSSRSFEELKRHHLESDYAEGQRVGTELRKKITASGCLDVDAEIERILASGSAAEDEKVLRKLDERLQIDAIRPKEAMPSHGHSNKRADDRVEHYHQSHNRISSMPRNQGLRRRLDKIERDADETFARAARFGPVSEEVIARQSAKNQAEIDQAMEEFGERIPIQPRSYFTDNLQNTQPRTHRANRASDFENRTYKRNSHSIRDRNTGYFADASNNTNEYSDDDTEEDAANSSNTDMKFSNFGPQNRRQETTMNGLRNLFQSFGVEDRGSRRVILKSHQSPNNPSDNDFYASQNPSRGIGCRPGPQPYEHCRGTGHQYFHSNYESYPGNNYRNTANDLRREATMTGAFAGDEVPRREKNHANPWDLPRCGIEEAGWWDSDTEIDIKTIRKAGKDDASPQDLDYDRMVSRKANPTGFPLFETLRNEPRRGRNGSNPDCPPYAREATTSPHTTQIHHQELLVPNASVPNADQIQMLTAMTDGVHHNHRGHVVSRGESRSV